MEIKQGFEFKESNNDDLIKEGLIRRIINGFNINSGCVNINEISNNQKIKEDEILKLKTNSEIINYNEEEEVIKAFKLIDKDGNGLISTAEFNFLLRTFGDNLKEEDIDSLINELDPDHDGYINYMEYVKMKIR